MSKARFWQHYDSWEEANLAWQEGAQLAAQTSPIKQLSSLPQMVGITKETAKNLWWKSLKWVVTQDHEHKILKGFLRHPFKHSWRLFHSLLRSASFTREGDLFFYGVDNVTTFQKELHHPETLFLLGFSYCHKPFECPSGRFSDQCIYDPDHPVCRQCFIGKCINALPTKNSVAVTIPTIHAIGAKVFELQKQFPNKKILFLITACEMTLTMFGDLGNMANIRGIGIRLDGRICNTFKAFELSEKGVKPGLTVVLPETQETILSLIASFSASH